MDPHEMPLEMARRHVVEAQQRLARQERLVAELERGGGTDALLPEARALLGRMRDFLEVCQEHHRYYLTKQEGGRDEATFQRVLDLLNTTGVEPSPKNQIQSEALPPASPNGLSDRSG